MSTAQLAIAWDELSSIQRQAAEWEAGSVLILAGPGSGKTRVLTCHIARILDSSTDQNFRVLGLTFTNKAADEMRNRVETYVPGRENRLFLGTFHSFCADILRQHGEHVGVKPDFNIYSQDDDLQEILNDAVDETKEHTDGITEVHKKTLPAIHRLKSLLVSPNECASRFRDVQTGRLMSALYAAYEAQLAKRNALDFDSLVLKAHELFARYPAFAKRYRTVYAYICVDEFQDTNQAQYGFLKSLCGKNGGHLFVVADDDQIIYQWNGASHKRINELLEDYSPAILQLPTNYRCPPQIVRSANSLIRFNFLRQQQKEPLRPFRTDSAPGALRVLPVFPSFGVEAAEIAKDIKALHAGHFGSVAILARNRRLLEDARQALENEGIPAVISQRKDEFESAPFVWLHSILRLANDKQNRRYLEAVVGAFALLTGQEIDPDPIITQAQASHLSYLEQWMKSVRQLAGDGISGEAAAEVARFLGGGGDFRSFCNWALRWFDGLVQNRRTLGQTPDPAVEVFAGYEDERVVWLALTAEIERALGNEATLEAFLQEVEMRSKESISGPDKVVLTTIHSAKGREFDHVYLIGLMEDELPSFQSKQKGAHSPEMEEERRNCFVAITRAKETLTLSFSESYRGWRRQPSRFLTEMGVM